MKNATTLVDGKEVEIYYANARPSGYGHMTITIELLYNDEIGEFTATTDDMPAYDEATDLEGEEKSLALYKIIEHQIEDEVTEWLTIKSVMTSESRGLALVTAFIVYSGELTNGSFFNIIDEAITMAEEFVKIYPHDYGWIEEDFEEVLLDFIKNKNV
jgi:hypothetical protein